MTFENKIVYFSDVIAKTDTSFEQLEPSYFLEGIRKVEEWYTILIEFGGDYLEK